MNIEKQQYGLKYKTGCPLVDPIGPFYQIITSHPVQRV